MDGGQISGVAALGRVLSVSGSQAQVRLAVGSSDERAFLYSSGKMRDLNSMIPAGSGWSLTTATAIDDTGLIAGYGFFRGEEHAFLLTPGGGTPSHRRRASSSSL